MDAFIARQPIFNTKRQVTGYELLYRDGVSGNRAVFPNGDRATCHLLSDAITVFGLPKLTNRKPAYVNFTQNLILSDFVLLAKPQEVVVELLEDIQITETLLAKLKFLKERGYVLALDDYAGNKAFDQILPFIDILKVDFRLTTPEQRREISHLVKQQRGLRLLAEKVETQEEFSAAVKQGYRLFQGYFFQKPVLLQKKIPYLAASSYGRILREMRKNDIDLDSCARIIHSDAVLTYRIMQKVQTLKYYRGNIITAIRQALVVMGTNELRRWIILMLARDNNVTFGDELVRMSYLRGVFTERLIAHTPQSHISEDGFLLGMFSLLDRILGMSMPEVLQDLDLPNEISDALLGRSENFYAHVLQYLTTYEMMNPNISLPDIGLDISEQQVSRLYLKCIMEVDKSFNDMGDESWGCEERTYWR